MVAAAATGGDVLIKNVTPKHLEPITAKLRRAGAEVEEFDASTGSIAHTAPPATSIVRSTSATVCGTSASTHAIRIATTSTLTVLWCT